MRQRPKTRSRRKRRVVVTEVKIRVRLLRRMRRSDVVSAVMEALETGQVPDTLEIAYWDYGHERGGVVRPGQRMSGEQMDELMKFRDMLLSVNVTGPHVGGRATLRVAVPDDTDGVEEE